MKHSILFIMLSSCIALANAQSPSPAVGVARWDFSGVSKGAKTNIAASSVAPGVTVSNLADSGGLNPVGIVTAPIGGTKIAGSDPFDGPAYGVGMATTDISDNLGPASYSLNFTITVKEGFTLSLTRLSYSLGYATSHTNTNFAVPRARLYYSLDGGAWTAAGSPRTIDADFHLFQNLPSGAYFVDNSIGVPLAGIEPLAGLKAGAKVHFKLALADDRSDSSRRHILLDDINLTGVFTPAP
jgi:hypothetical protein